VSRYSRQRLLDVQAALDAIDSHLGRGDSTVTHDLPRLRAAITRLLVIASAD
jgi:hypothetical protein